MAENTLISYQITIVFAAIISGGMAALFYDIYKLLVPKRQPICSYLVADIVFAVCLFIISALLWFTLTDGSLRLLDSIWFGFGAIIYHASIKRPLFWLNNKLHSLLTKFRPRENKKPNNTILHQKNAKIKQKNKSKWYENHMIKGFLLIFKSFNVLINAGTKILNKLIISKKNKDEETDDDFNEN